METGEIRKETKMEAERGEGKGTEREKKVNSREGGGEGQTGDSKLLLCLQLTGSLDAHF